MTLNEWLRANPDWNQSKLAAEMGRSQGYVSMLCSGDIWPGPAAARAIHRITDGAVTLDDLAAVREERMALKREAAGDAA